MKLPKNLREQLKIPLGDLITEKNLKKENILKKINIASTIITVGDRTSENMIGLGIIPQIQIIDGLEKRNKRDIYKDMDVSVKYTELNCRNPPGEVTKESMEVIGKAFSCEQPVRIIVKGEEDLLVIPVCIFAPENSVVMYGQPNEGLVLVHITPEIRSKIQKILDSMN